MLGLDSWVRIGGSLEPASLSTFNAIVVRSCLFFSINSCNYKLTKRNGGHASKFRTHAHASMLCVVSNCGRVAEMKAVGGSSCT